MKSASTLLVSSAIAFAVAGCSAASDATATHSGGLVFHKEGKSGGSEHVGSASQALTDDDCGVTGMNVCDETYWDALWLCYYDWCKANGADEATADQCGNGGYQSGQNDCSAVTGEQQLCSSGLVDPTTCSTGTGGTGGGDTTGGTDTGGGGGSTCTNCDCYGGTTDFHGQVCGSSATELVSECDSSCY